MSGPKTLYNSSSLDCALELLRRSMGVQIHLTSADCNVESLDGEFARLNVVSRVSALDGSLSEYFGSSNYTYRKFALETILPTDLVYDGEYPAPFERLQQFLQFSYDFLLEENEFLLEGGTGVPLKAGDMINVPANSDGQIVLTASNNSGRWKAGQQLKLKRLIYTLN